MHAHEHSVKRYFIVIDINGKVVFVDRYFVAGITVIIPTFGCDVDYIHIEFVSVDIIIDRYYALITYLRFPAVTTSDQRNFFLHYQNYEGKEM